MNEIAKIEQPIHGLVPSSMGEAMKLADMMASARLVPQGLQKSPADCLMVIQQAIRWQMDPFAVAQECSVIQGKLMHSGKLVAAVVNARGNLTQRLSFEYRGDGDNRTIVVSGQLQGEPSPRVVDVVLKNARTQNKVWQTQPDQQLMYHGVRVWARRHTPELMLGVYSPEEFDEPAPARAAAKMAPTPAKNVMLPAHDEDTGEIIEVEASEVSTQRLEPGASGEAAAAAPNPAAAAEIPTAEAYVEQWNAIINGATNAQQLHKTWSGQKSLRNKIDWPEDGTFDGLRARVQSAIEALKAPA